MARLWSNLRNTLVEQEQTIQRLEQQARAGTPFEPPPRPPSSASVVGLRAAIDQAMAEAADLENTSKVFQVITSLPVLWVRQRLDSDRDHSRNNALGCWFSGRSASHKDYVKVNWTKLAHPTTGRPLEVQPYIHQLSIVASGRGDHLHRAGTGGTHQVRKSLLSGDAGQMLNRKCEQVSHLCHNGGCYNPNHLVVEPKELNLARNSCQGRYILVGTDKTTIHPCEHWNWGGKGEYKHCILPQRIVNPSLRGKWVDSVQDGFVARTGRSDQAQ
jgi:hypothetical protein